MAQRQFRSDDTSAWLSAYGDGSGGVGTISSNTTDDATRTPKTTISVTSGSTAATFGSFTGFADGDLGLIYQSRNGGAGAGAWELNKIASHSGTNITLAQTTTQAYDTTAQFIKLVQFSSFTVNAACTLTAQSWSSGSGVGGVLPILCKGTVTVSSTGFISANGCGYAGGAVGAGSSLSFTGEGTLAASSSSGSTNGNGAGGVSSGYGAGGGNGAAGSNSPNSPNPATGGLSAGNAGLTVMVYGGGGSGGSSGGNAPTAGANGGGVVIIIAPTITISGGITTNGSTPSAAAGRAGGGGAGGSCLLKGQIITLGTSLVTASGGNGASGGDNPSTSGAGAVGRIHVDYMTSLSGTTTPTLDSRQDSSLHYPVGASFFPSFYRRTMTAPKQPNGTNLTTYRVDQLEIKLDDVNDNVEKIMTNHLPHLKEDIIGVKTQINMIAALNISLAILGFIVSKLLK